MAEAVSVTPGSVARWEQGVALPKARLRGPLANLLQVTLPELERMLNGAERRPAPNGHTVPPWLDHYASLEQGAARLQTFEPITLPGLLQTAAYAEAVMRTSWQSLAEDVIRDRVEARLARQAVLDREPEPLELICVIDESILNRVTGSRQVMADKLAQLAETTRRPTVQLQVCRARSSALHTVPCGPFSLFTSVGASMPFMACAETLSGVQYQDSPQVIESHAELFDHLTTIALPPEQSAELIQQIAERYL